MNDIHQSAGFVLHEHFLQLNATPQAKLKCSTFQEDLEVKKIILHAGPLTSINLILLIINLQLMPINFISPCLTSITLTLLNLHKYYLKLLMNFCERLEDDRCWNYSYNLLLKIILTAVTLAHIIEWCTLSTFGNWMPLHAYWKSPPEGVLARPRLI